MKGCSRRRDEVLLCESCVSEVDLGAWRAADEAACGGF